jgi:hypothetical protein
MRATLTALAALAAAAAAAPSGQGAFTLKLIDQTQ